MSKRSAQPDRCSKRPQSWPGSHFPPGSRSGSWSRCPAAALKTSAFVPHVDFVSIGTNDLAQYTLAVERGNDGLAALADPLDPAVLRLVGEVCRGVAGRVRIGVCGELASDPVAVPLLAGLGVIELSVTPYAVPLVKQAVRELDVPAYQVLAGEALADVGSRGQSPGGGTYTVVNVT